MAPSTTPAPSADLIDALPYVDRDVDDLPGAREAARALVDAELAQLGGPQQSHPRMPDGLEDDLFSRAPALSALLANYPDQTLSALDTSLFQLPTPSSATASEAEWAAAASNAKAQLEHLHVRQTNVSLMAAHGPNAHLIHNHVLEAEAKRLEHSVEVLKLQVTDVNRRRRQTQTDTKTRLDRLESQWAQLISGTLQTSVGVAALEAEVESLRRKERELGIEA